MWDIIFEVSGDKQVSTVKCALSLLMTDVGDEICWWHVPHVGDGLGGSGHQNL